jgi:hypothetical protein
VTCAATTTHKRSLRRLQKDSWGPKMDKDWRSCAGPYPTLLQLESGLYSCMALPSASVFLPRSF